MIAIAGARYLDPEIGRWLSVDPLAAKFPAWSPYNYTMGNPMNLVDPDGMAPDFYKNSDGHIKWKNSTEATLVDASGDKWENIGETHQLTREGIDFVLFQTENDDGNLTMDSMEMFRNPLSGEIKNDPGTYSPDQPHLFCYKIWI